MYMLVMSLQVTVVDSLVVTYMLNSQVNALLLINIISMKIIIPGVCVAAKHTRDSITMAIIIVHKFHEKGNSFLYYCLIFQWHGQLQLVTWLVMICIYTDPIYRPKSQINLCAYYWQGTFLKSWAIIEESLFERGV